MRKINPDIIHTWILQMDVLGGMAARLTGIPWVFREPSSAMAYPPTWKNRLRVTICAGAKMIVANSAGGDSYWQERLPCSHRAVIPNGLPIAEIDATEAAIPPGVPDSDDPLVLYVGRLAADRSASKNLMPFLEALARVNQHLPINGVICGEGPQRPELEKARHRLGLEQAVRFTGHVPPSTVWGLMKRATVFVSLSDYEGCPNTVMEAMACGCPLVLSDIPAHREILDEECAQFVDVSSVEQVAEVILQGLCMRESAKRRAAVARQRAQHWSVAEMARRWEAVYRFML